VGKADPKAHYLDPTLLYPVTWEDKIMEDEIFGPILPILTYKTFDEAMTRMAATPRALAGFIFSRDQETIDRFIGELSFGGGGVNLVNVHLFVETMPFGGTGSAGMGHYYGKYGFDALTHAKSILISPPDVAIEHLYSPFTMRRTRRLKGGSNIEAHRVHQHRWSEPRPTGPRELKVRLRFNTSTLVSKKVAKPAEFIKRTAAAKRRFGRAIVSWYRIYN